MDSIERIQQHKVRQAEILASRFVQLIDETVIEKADDENSEDEKVAKVMREFKDGTLKSNGKVVTDRKQALAIAMSESGQAKDKDEDEKETEKGEDDELEKAGRKDYSKLVARKVWITRKGKRIEKTVWVRPQEADKPVKKDSAILSGKKADIAFKVERDGAAYVGFSLPTESVDHTWMPDYLKELKDTGKYDIVLINSTERKKDYKVVLKHESGAGLEDGAMYKFPSEKKYLMRYNKGKDHFEAISPKDGHVVYNTGISKDERKTLKIIGKDDTNSGKDINELKDRTRSGKKIYKNMLGTSTVYRKYSPEDHVDAAVYHDLIHKELNKVLVVTPEKLRTKDQIFDAGMHIDIAESHRGMAGRGTISGKEKSNKEYYPNIKAGDSVKVRLADGVHEVNVVEYDKNTSVLKYTRTDGGQKAEGTVKMSEQKPKDVVHKIVKKVTTGDEEQDKLYDEAAKDWGVDANDLKNEYKLQYDKAMASFEKRYGDEEYYDPADYEEDAGLWAAKKVYKKFKK